MSKPQQWLGALLALQVLLTAGLYVHGRQLEARQSQQTAILTFDKASLDKLVLTGKDDAKVTLSKVNGEWRMPDYHDLPVDANKIDDLLVTLSELKGGWPVSTSADSQEQFEVAEKKFGTRLELMAGDKPVAQLYLGTSPGFRKTHLRAANSENIYAAEFNSMDLPLNNDQWFDRSLLKAKELSQIQGKDFTLKKDAAGWTLDGKDAKVNGTNASFLATTLSGLRVDSLQASPPQGAPTLTLQVVADGKPLTYEFWSRDGQKPVVRRSDIPHSFEMSKAAYDALLGSDLAKLTEPTEEEARASSTPTPNASATPASATPAPATPPPAATP